MLIAQFNDGLGWRGNRSVPADTSMEDAIAFAKEHWGNLNEKWGSGRWLEDHLRLVEVKAPGEFAIVWWQDGSSAEPKMGPI